MHKNEPFIFINSINWQGKGREKAKLKINWSPLRIIKKCENFKMLSVLTFFWCGTILCTKHVLRLF